MTTSTTPPPVDDALRRAIERRDYQCSQRARIWEQVRDLSKRVHAQSHRAALAAHKQVGMEEFSAEWLTIRTLEDAAGHELEELLSLSNSLTRLVTALGRGKS